MLNHCNSRLFLIEAVSFPLLIHLLNYKNVVSACSSQQVRHCVDIVAPDITGLISLELGVRFQFSLVDVLYIRHVNTGCGHFLPWSRKESFREEREWCKCGGKKFTNTVNIETWFVINEKVNKTLKTCSAQCFCHYKEDGPRRAFAMAHGVDLLGGCMEHSLACELSFFLL